MSNRRQLPLAETGELTVVAAGLASFAQDRLARKVVFLDYRWLERFTHASEGLTAMFYDLNRAGETRRSPGNQ